MGKLTGIIQRVDPVKMCQLFNEGKYWERLQSGEFTAKMLDDRHQSLMKADEPYCTQSQSIAYLDSNGMDVVRIHQYLRPDNTLGAGGLPDPKRLYQDGIW